MKSLKTIIFTLSVLILFSIVPFSFASVESEAQEDVQAGCLSGESLVYRSAYRDYVCVPPDTAERWVSYGVAKIIIESKQVQKAKPSLVNSDFYGAPPAIPEKIYRTPDLDPDCRFGYVTFYKFHYLTESCINFSTANSWEKSGLGKIVKLEEKSVDLEVILDDSLKETETIFELNNDEVRTNESDLFLLSEKLDFLYSPKIHHISDRIWVAVGYGNTNSILIEGNTGIIVIDTLNSYESSKKVLEEFRTITDKPIKTIIHTTLNPGIVNGTKAFLEEGDDDVEIIINEDLLGSYIAEYNLEYYNSYEHELVPQITHTFSTEFSLDISGVKMNIFSIEGYNSDQIYIFLPDDDGILMGDSVFGISPFIFEMKYFQNFFN